MGRHIVRYINNLLPNEYTQLESLTDSSGTCYIDSGIRFDSLNKNDKLEVDLSYTIPSNTALGAQYQAQILSLIKLQSNAARAFADKCPSASGSSTDRHVWVFEGDGNYTNIYADGELKMSAPKGCNQNNIYFFCLNLDGTRYDNAKATFYSVKYWDDGVLSKHFIPAKRKSDDVLGMYEIINRVFYTNLGTGTFTAGQELSDNVCRGLVVSREGEAPPAVPGGYTAVKAIKSNGSQYFQTSWIPDFTKDIVINGDVGFTTLSRGMWFANYGSSGQTFSIELYNNYYLRFFCDADVINISTAIGSLSTLIHTTYNYTASTGALTLSCSTGAVGSGTIPSGKRVKHTSAVWFGTDNSGHRYPYGYFGKLKITEGGVDVIDYQPCMNSEGVYGMYDYVTETFYPSTTGTGFLLGEDYVVTTLPHAIKTQEVNN